MPASFSLFSFFSNNIFTEESEDFIGIWTRIVGAEGTHADHYQDHHHGSNWIFVYTIMV